MCWLKAAGAGPPFFSRHGEKGNLELAELQKKEREAVFESFRGPGGKRPGLKFLALCEDLGIKLPMFLKLEQKNKDNYGCN